MNRQQVLKQVEDVFGFVPTFLKSLSDPTLELEWHLLKRVQLDEGPIPNRFRELIGVGIAAAVRCPYSAILHSEMARLNGATPAELEDALHFAKSSSGWSTYLNGTQADLGEFRGEIKRATEYVKMKQGSQATLRPSRPDIIRYG